VYRKTSDGQDEISTRARRLPPRQRSLLILIDGKRSDSDLHAMVPGAEALLAELLAAGLIEQTGAPVRTESRASAPTRVDVPVAAESTAGVPSAPVELLSRPMALSASTLKARSMAASRWLNERLGPAGETAAIRVEGAKNAEQLEQALQFAARIVEARLGPAAAQTLITHVATL
jgi:hypothetical protein